MESKNTSKETKEYIFFSMNDFTNDGGGTIRMYGVLNALAKAGYNVTFISNAKTYSNFHPDIKHILLDFSFSKKDKRKIQFIMSICPTLANYTYRNFLNQLKEVLAPFKELKNIYSFEYLDNSIAYWLYKNKVIQGYSNDIHGIATLEFDYIMQNATSLKVVFINRLKYLIAKKLDAKVLGNARYNIYVGKEMEKYFLELYSNISEKQSIILPNLLDEKACDIDIDTALQEKFKKDLKISSSDRIILFAGSFKYSAGVLELIQSFEEIEKAHSNLRMLLIGNGPTYEVCQNYIKKNKLSDKIQMLGFTPYKYLPTLHSLADIIVCPDQMNEFSDKIIHLKYLDALLANKVVINGDFQSVLEINKNESLSVGFDPTEPNSLTSSLERVLKDLERYKLKYKNTKAYACEHLTYKNQIHLLTSSNLV